MKIAVFDIFAPYAYFKIPEGTRSSYSFPFPPKTALLGLVAGILGEERNQYWKDDSKFLELKFGVEILNPYNIESIKVNYWRSRSTITVNDYTFVLPGDVSSRGHTTQVKLDLLKDVKFRIYIGFKSTKNWDELITRLSSNRYFYPPYLGQANLLAEIEYQGLYESQNITSGNFLTVIPQKALISNLQQDFSELGAFTLVYGIPIAYKTEKTTMNDFIMWNSSPDGSESFIVPPFSEKLNLKLEEGYGFSINMDSSKLDICIF